MLWSDPATLDPHLTTDATSAAIVVELFSGLVELNADLQLVPDIAERWEISDDGTVYTFFLRPDAKFHNGKPITASDFKWSIERAVSPDTASLIADVYLSDIVGFNGAWEGLTDEVSGVKVIGDLTLQITIYEAYADFLNKLTSTTAYVLDRENVEGGGQKWTDVPNGSGPFRLKEYRIGERIILERFDEYYRQPAHLDAVVFDLAGDDPVAMYENNEIDIRSMDLFDLEDGVLDPQHELNMELVVRPPDFNVSYVGFNTSMAPFDDAKFRQALNHAVNKELIATEVLSDLVQPAYGVLPPGFPGFNPDLQGLTYDPELARQLLSESSYASPVDRPKIIVAVPGSADDSIGLDLENVIEMWNQELGVEVEIHQAEWGAYLQELQQDRFQVFAGLGWEATAGGDPADFLDILFHTDSSQNHGHYSNPEVDAILEEASIDLDYNRRVRLYQQAEQMIVDDAAWLPLWYQGKRYVLIKPHVMGYKLTSTNVPKLRHVYLAAPAER